jgi:hypothetical protein
VRGVADAGESPLCASFGEDVQSPHYMEDAVPDRVVQELEKVLDNP